MLTTQATSLLWYKESKMMPMVFFVTLLLTRSTTKTEGQLTQQGIFFEVTEDHCCLHDEDIWSGEVESLVLCSQMCAWREDCKSAVYMIEQGTCSLTGKSQTENPDLFHGMKGCVYLRKRKVKRWGRETHQIWDVLPKLCVAITGAGKLS
ncbi:uncharacterized protein [Montipora foliosa]|uniref:uncharacterized protein n=1 Tax=Montipora foliosa TaxID=591990 RepID=UPI0035F16D38